MLPEVFGILQIKYYNRQNNNDSNKKIEYETSPRNTPVDMRNTYNMAEFWKFRLICKDWNNAIEKIHRNKDAGHFWMLEDFKTAKNSKQCKKWATESFGEESEVRELIDHFESTHYDFVTSKPKKCPFLGQSIDICHIGREDENEQPYYDAVNTMLQKYGDQVLYFRELHISSEEKYVYWYQKLKQIIELMPNLKVLRISWISVAAHDLLALEHEILRNPFSKIPKLDFLATFQVPGPLLNHLINSNRHVKRLQTVAGNFLNNRTCDTFTEYLPNLTHLCFEANSVDDFERFENYRHPLKLVKLNIYWNGQENVPFIPWSRIFTAIEAKIGLGFCTELCLQMPAPRTQAQRKLVLEESLSCRLHVANLQHILVQQSGTRFFIDFLLQLKNSLTEIEIICDTEQLDFDQDNLQHKQVIKFVGFEDRMEDSNIINELPILKSLKVAGQEQREYVIESGIVKFKEKWNF